MPFCIKCGRKFVRHRIKGTRRNNSKICSDCKINKGRTRCIVCKRKMNKSVFWQKTCSKRCRRLYDRIRSKEYRNKHREIRTIPPIRKDDKTPFRFHKELG